MEVSETLERVDTSSICSMTAEEAWLSSITETLRTWRCAEENKND
jgi:hypothetical protein